ncbi:hypothetical protein KIW84_034676 [Lathyrus oleraceus]|uniref:G domain-containing protein n=1 Tax=Pisum sativum TaxID=3888 RepID=A0A9D4Y1K5_PEA|nr:hypothetical protein KIW84_034676 [Pisum sativum]
MGGGSIVSSSNGMHGDFPFLRDNSVESENTSSCDDFVVSERKKRVGINQEILQSFNELKIDSESLKKGKKKILSYRPGASIWKARGLKVCDYDIPETTCLILVGPSLSGKTSLINRISKVFDNDKFAPARAQVSYNSLIGDGTYFLHEYMIPRNSNSICLYDTRSLSDKSHENNKMLKNWMTKGVRDGELVVRSIDNQRLCESLKCKGDDKKGFISNDKPVLVITHGDLLSLSDCACVRAFLGDLLGIPPTTQIFDIPDSDDPVTESAIIGMLRHTLEHADRNFPLKSNVMNKVFKISASLFMILLILGIGFAIGLAQNKFMHQCHAPQQQAPQPQACSSEVHEMHPNLKICKNEPKIERPEPKVPEKEPKIEWHKIRHIW